MSQKNQNIRNDKKLQQMFIRKNLGENRRETYIRVFGRVYQLTQLTPSQLLDIAKEEQKPKLRDGQIEFKELEDRTITNIQYSLYSHLSDQGIANLTIKTELATFRAFFNEYNVQLPKNIDITADSNLYETGDLPTKEDILQAIQSTNNKRNKALIYFLSSSGIRPIDARNFRIKDFLKGCSYYLGENATLEDLYNSDYEHIIPYFYFRPQKTRRHGNICCTFCSNESVQSILDYLKTRYNVKEDDYLFASREGGRIAHSTYVGMFRAINDKEFGRNRFGERFFQAKHLRKYFISTCNQHSGDLLKVRLLAGHTIADIDKAYNEINIDAMRRFYISLLPYLNLHDTSVKTVKSKEYQDLERKLRKQEIENQKLKSELDEKISRVVHDVLENYR